MTERIDWSGAFTGAATPFNSDGEIDFAQFDRVISHLSKGGLAGIVVNASLSEGILLTLDERISCVTHAIRHENRPAVLSGLYGASTRDAAEEARLVARAGADALLIWPSQAFGGGTPNTDMIVNHYSEIHKASGLPLIIFRLRGSVAPEIGAEALCALAQVPGVIAVKDSVGDPDFYTGPAEFLHPNSPLKVMADSDVRLLTMLQRGAHGAMSMVAAIFPQAVADLVRLRSRAEAGELQLAIKPLSTALAADPGRDFRARIKFLLVHTGVITNADVRRPLLELSRAEKNLLVQAYDETKTRLEQHYARCPPVGPSSEEARNKVAIS